MAYTNQEVLEALLAIVLKLIEQGQAEQPELLEVVGGKKSLLDKALKKGNQAKALTRKVQGADTPGQMSVVYQLMHPDRYRGKGPESILEELFQIEQESKLKYSQYMPFECTLVLERPSLGSDPGGENRLVWPRIAVNGSEGIWVRPYWFKAWLAEGARLAGSSDKLLGAIRNKHIWFEDVILEGVKLEEHPLMAPSGAGKRGGGGVNAVEALPIGTRIPIRLQYPSTAVEVEELISALQHAASMVGFSPSRHYDGWGRGRLELSA